MLKYSGSIEDLVSRLVVVTSLGKGFLRISISIVAIRSEGKIKTSSTYGAFIGSHRSVMSVPVLGALFKSSTVCNVVLRKIHFWIEYKLVIKPKSKPKPKLKPFKLHHFSLEIFRL